MLTKTQLQFRLPRSHQVVCSANHSAATQQFKSLHLTLEGMKGVVVKEIKKKKKIIPTLAEFVKPQNELSDMSTFGHGLKPPIQLYKL